MYYFISWIYVSNTRNHVVRWDCSLKGKGVPTTYTQQLHQMVQAVFKTATKKLLQAVNHRYDPSTRTEKDVG
jgi:hypothetical protein